MENTNKYELFAYNLYRFGFPMMHEGLDTTDLPIEELIVRVLTELPNPRFILGLPVIIYNHEIDAEKLYGLAKQHDAINSVGWVLEEAYETYLRCAKNRRQDIKQLINKLRPLKKEGEQVITTEKTQCFIPYARKRQTSPAKRWKILSGSTEESFDYEFKRWCHPCLEELIAKN